MPFGLWNPSNLTQIWGSTNDVTKSVNFLLSDFLSPIGYAVITEE